MTYALKPYRWIGLTVALTCVLLLSLTAGGWANSAPVVTHVHAEQRGGSTLVDITYDVADEASVLRTKSFKARPRTVWSR